MTGKTNYEALSVSATTQNRISGVGYDAAGNMTSNGSATYLYDAENRVINTAGHTYIYDGEGRRVAKCLTPNQSAPASCSGAAAANGTIYWLHNHMAEVESDLAGNYTEVYARLNGKLLARIDLPANTASYYHTDMLGTADVITDVAGNVTQDCRVPHFSRPLREVGDGFGKTVSGSPNFHLRYIRVVNSRTIPGSP